jgi:hypothetical protein
MAQPAMWGELTLKMIVRGNMTDREILLLHFSHVTGLCFVFLILIKIKI